jgi:hypothetical protein
MTPARETTEIDIVYSGSPWFLRNKSGGESIRALWCAR